MAIVSSHTLDSVTGAHAGGVAVALWRIAADGSRTLLFDTATDAGGRLNETVAVGTEDAGARYELVVGAGGHFAAQPGSAGGGRIVDEVVVRFRMPDPDGRYHIPMMLAPNSCSMWWSS